jgi:hypothetical protein
MMSERQWETALAELPAHQRHEFAEASPLSWVRIETLDATFRTVAASLGKNAVDLHREVVRSSVSANVKGIWRLLLRFTSVEALVTRLPRIYSRAFSGGRAVVTEVREESADFQVEEWPAMPEYARRGLAVGTEAVIELTQRANVKVRHVGFSPDLATRFTVTWSAARAGE